MNQQHFCVPGNWSTKDVCRLKLGIVRHAFAHDSTEILYLDQREKVWKLVESDYEKVNGETVACLFTFEEVSGEEWTKVLASAVAITERLGGCDPGERRMNKIASFFSSKFARGMLAGSLVGVTLWGMYFSLRVQQVRSGQIQQYIETPTR